MNRELLIQVRDRIASVDAEAALMATWIGPEVASKRPNGWLSLAGEGACETSGCIAGHTIALATGEFRVFYDLHSDVIDFEDGFGRKVEWPADVAAKLLDLTTEQCCHIFYPNDWEQKFRTMKHNEGDQKAMIALLDAIIDGTYVWDETHRRWRHIAEIEEELAAEFDDAEG